MQGKLNLVQDGIFGPITEEAVRDFQQRKGLTADGIVGARTWAALGPESGRQTVRSITDIILHCTATPEGKAVTVASIKAGHLARGFKDIGYHYVIGLDGTISKGRDEAIIGAHCTGHNAHSIGISYVGGVDKADKPKDTRTAAQKAAMARLVKELLGKYPGAKVKGHRDYSPDLNGNGTVEPSEWIKACPCFEVKEWLPTAGIKQ